MSHWHRGENGADSNFDETLMTQPIHTLDEQGIVTICPGYGRRNRVRYETLDRPARCGSCRAGLPPSQEPFNIPNTDAFASLVGQATLPVLVDFWALWCAWQRPAPDRSLSPRWTPNRGQSWGYYKLVDCPLTRNPWISTVYGAFIGALMAGSFP